MQLTSATSPNEFILARLDAKKNERELIIGEWGTLGASGVSGPAAEPQRKPFFSPFFFCAAASASDFSYSAISSSVM